MADNRKYYYLELKESYFDDDAIVLLESMPDGILYSNILLKLYLKSLKNGGKLQLCSIPDEEWKTVEEKAIPFWEEMAKSSPRAAQVVAAFRKYNAVMAKAGKPYRY